MHTGDRSADAIDAGGVLPGYAGIIVRDGYSGYAHLTDALHAWCGAHLLRDLKDLYDFEEGTQDWARDMAALLVEARDAARDARRAGETALDPQVLADLTGRYRSCRRRAGREPLPEDRHSGGRTADRPPVPEFRGHDLPLRTRPDLDIFTNNEAERTIRPVKVQQRSSGGCWRTPRGLADFAVIQVDLSTAAKWASAHSTPSTTSSTARLDTASSDPAA